MASARGTLHCAVRTSLELLTCACWQILRLFRSLCGSFGSAVSPVANQPSDDVLVAQVQQLFLPATESEDSKVILKGSKSCQASRAAFRTLQDCNWLHDEVVNLYMQLLQGINLQQRAIDLGVPKSYIFNTFFWTRLACFGSDFDYAGVARWTKKVDVFSQDLLLIPINHNSLHWCLAAVDMNSKKIFYYDSMLGNGLSGRAQDVVLPTLERWLKQELLDKKDLQEDSTWEHKTVADLPEQQDSGSCGAFACMYAKQLLAGADPANTFCQKDIPGIRLQIAADLLRAYQCKSN